MPLTFSCWRGIIGNSSAGFSSGEWSRPRSLWCCDTQPVRPPPPTFLAEPGGVGSTLAPPRPKAHELLRMRAGRSGSLVDLADDLRLPLRGVRGDLLPERDERGDLLLDRGVVGDFPDRGVVGDFPDRGVVGDLVGDFCGVVGVWRGVVGDWPLLSCLPTAPRRPAGKGRPHLGGEPLLPVGKRRGGRGGPCLGGEPFPPSAEEARRPPRPSEEADESRRRHLDFPDLADLPDDEGGPFLSRPNTAARSSETYPAPAAVTSVSASPLEELCLNTLKEHSGKLLIVATNFSADSVRRSTLSIASEVGTRREGLMLLIRLHLWTAESFAGFARCDIVVFALCFEKAPSPATSVWEVGVAVQVCCAMGSHAAEKRTRPLRESGSSKSACHPPHTLHTEYGPANKHMISANRRVGDVITM